MSKSSKVAEETCSRQDIFPFFIVIFSASLPHCLFFLSPSLSLLEELDCSCNELESLPPTIGYLHSLRTFAADENFLTELPREVGLSTLDEHFHIIISSSTCLGIIYK